MKSQSIALLSLLTGASAFSPASIVPSSSQSHPTTSSSSTRTSRLNAFAAVGEAVETFYQTQPYVAAFVTCGVKASAADLLAQTKSNEQPAETSVAVAADDATTSVDAKRNLGFLFYGGIYTGLCQQFMYNTLFPSLFGGLPMVESVVMQVLTDMLLIGPLLCLPTAYAVKCLFGKDDDESIQDAATTTLHKYIEDVTERNLLTKYWALWTPVQVLTFTVIPAHFRVAFIAAVSFFWMIILSSTAADTGGAATSNASCSDNEALHRKLLEQRLKYQEPTL